MWFDGAACASLSRWMRVAMDALLVSLLAKVRSGFWGRGSPALRLPVDCVDLDTFVASTAGCRPVHARQVPLPGYDHHCVGCSEGSQL